MTCSHGIKATGDGVLESRDENDCGLFPVVQTPITELPDAIPVMVQVYEGYDPELNVQTDGDCVCTTENEWPPPLDAGIPGPGPMPCCPPPAASSGRSAKITSSFLMLDPRRLCSGNQAQCDQARFDAVLQRGNPALHCCLLRCRKWRDIGKIQRRHGNRH